MWLYKIQGSKKLNKRPLKRGIGQTAGWVSWKLRCSQGIPISFNENITPQGFAVQGSLGAEPTFCWLWVRRRGERDLKWSGNQRNPQSPKFKRQPGSPEDIPSSSLLLASWVLSLLLATLNYIARLLEGGWMFLSGYIRSVKCINLVFQVPILLGLAQKYTHLCVYI